MSSVHGLKIAAVLCVLGLFTAPTLAHGPQIQIGIENGRIVTRHLFEDEPYNGAVTPKEWVYEIPMTQRSLADADDGWYSEPTDHTPWTGPGIATALGGFATGSILKLTFADGLKIWNGSTFVDPGTEQIDAYRGAHVAFAVTSDVGPFQSFNFTAISNSGDEHKTARFRLLGNGAQPNTPSDDGVYLLSLKLETDQPGVQPSDTYYFLLNKNASQQDADAARNYLENEVLVPTVSTWGLLVLGLALLAAAKIAYGARSQRVQSA